MWDAFKDWIFSIIEFFYGCTGDWGLAIIIITIIIRGLLTPLTLKQVKSSYMMQKVQPRIKEIQERYANDQKRQSEELQKIYADRRYNPLMGCLPVLIQAPVFIALYQSLRTNIQAGSNFYNIIPDLAASPSEVYHQGIAAVLPYIILIALFALATLIPMLFMQDQKNKMTTMMAVFMTIMMVWFGWVAPAGVLLYWVASAFIGVGTNLIARRVYKARDKRAEEEAEPIFEVAPVEVNVERRERKSRPKKKR